MRQKKPGVKRPRLSEQQKQQIRNTRIEAWYNMKRSDATKLTRKAVRGNREAQAELLRFSWAISTEANKRISALQSADKAYGGGYNRVMHFLDIEYDELTMGDRARPDMARSPIDLKLDWYAMRLQNDQLSYWLTKDVSTVEGQVTREKHRLTRLQELGIISEEADYRESEDFLRWLGNEEISAALDEYGSSEVLVDAFYDLYKERGKSGLHLLSTAFLEYHSRKVTDSPLAFDSAMERAGVKIEDYINKWKSR